MKHLALLGFCLLAGSFQLFAQNIVMGTVTDKDGNPVPGAKVEIKGSTESTITELDGTFTLETKMPAKKVKVYYVGMQPKEQKVKPKMNIKMSNNSWWREKPDKYKWWIGVSAAFPENGISNPSLGLIFGRVKNIGWYVKGVYSKMQNTEGTLEYGSRDWVTGETKQSLWAATGGIIIRLWSPIHLYAGVGYIDRKVSWQVANNSYYEYTPDSYTSFAGDIGLMLKIKKIFIEGGVMCADNANKIIKKTGSSFDQGETEFIGSFSIGFNF